MHVVCVFVCFFFKCAGECCVAMHFHLHDAHVSNMPTTSSTRLDSPESIVPFFFVFSWCCECVCMCFCRMQCTTCTVHIMHIEHWVWVRVFSAAYRIDWGHDDSLCVRLPLFERLPFCLAIGWFRTMLIKGQKSLFYLFKFDWVAITFLYSDFDDVILYLTRMCPSHTHTHTLMLLSLRLARSLDLPHFSLCHWSTSFPICCSHVQCVALACVK